MEQELANPTTNVTSAGSYEDIMRLLRQLNVSDKDKVRPRLPPARSALRATTKSLTTRPGWLTRPATRDSRVDWKKRGE